MKNSEFLNVLADLTVNAENFEIALAALKLQTAITQSEKNKKMTQAEVMENVLGYV
jgi:hypothetical protein